MRSARRSSPWRILVPLFLLALTIRLWALDADRRDAVVHLGLECLAGTCFATLDDGPPLEVRELAGAGRVGLYVFHPSGSRDKTHFLNLSLRAGAETLALALTDVGEREAFSGDDGWTIDPGRGMRHEGEVGSRSIATLEALDSDDFRLELDLVDPIDAGVIFRAEDDGNGTLFIVRSLHNDAFFCSIEDGEPGAILEIMPLRELRSGRELLRVAGLVAEITLAAMLLLGALRLLCRYLPSRPIRVGWLDRLLSRDDAPRGWLPALFVLTVVVLSCVAILGFGAVPHIEDGSAYLFQAKIFASGRLWAPPPPTGGFFDHEHIIVGNDRWLAKYPPLFPLLLSLGVLAGMPWLVNPLLGALVGLVTYRLTRELADWRWGVAAWSLLLLSPFFVIMGGTLMSHMSAALLISLALLLTIRGVRLASVGRIALGGACLGLAVFARPYTALLAAFALSSYLMGRLAKWPERRRLVGLASILVGIVALCALGFVGWNGLLAGAEGPALGLYSAYDGTDTLGFGPDKGRGWWLSWGSWGHTPAKALRSVFMFLEYTSEYFLGWPMRLSLAFVPAAFFVGRRRDVRTLLLGLFGMLVAGHMAYWATQHLGYGARYWFSAVPALVVLTTLGLRWALGSAPSGDGSEARPAVSAGALSGAALVLGLCIWNAAVYFPERWRELAQYGNVTADLRREVTRRGLEQAVVFVWTEGLRYNDGFALNHPSLDGGPIFARDLGARNRELLQRYPGYRPYRWTRDKRLVPLSLRDLPVGVDADATVASGGLR
jgi:hypothetical protein